MDSEMDADRILGLFWKPDADYFTFNLKFLKAKEEIFLGEKIPTKRELLALVMSIYDPLGFLAHFTIKARIIIQETWRREVDWNDEIPKGIHEKWLLWLAELKSIHTFQIPRCYSPILSKGEDVQLHVFCDASEQAFGAVAYFRVAKGDQVNIGLITAKARVTPLKCLSMPRSELQAAVMGSRIAKYLKGTHDVKIHRTVYWTDSTCVYGWIRADGKMFPPFVSHRIGEIQDLTDAIEWNWVPGKENVADELTRDNKPCDWSSTSRWINGPNFLRLPESEWPKEKPKKGDLNLKALELKKEYFLAMEEEEFTFLTRESESPVINIMRYSTWSKAVRVRAYIQRCINYCRSKTVKKTTITHEIGANELKEAEIWWLREVQRESFFEEIKKLQNHLTVEKTNRLYKLNPFLDENGVMRVNGRLAKAKNLSFAVKYPVILDPKHPFTQLLLTHHHQRGGHHGRERIVNELKQKYFIFNIRTAVQTAYKNCQQCKNEKTQPMVPEMGQLPTHRLESYGAPFANTGLDYFGPIEVTVGRRREKRYVALFTCLSTRAVHLEIAHSLSTDSCILAIRKFVCRRGCPEHLYSDNGTNFVGANNELRRCLKELNQEDLVKLCTSKGFTWHFNPPAAPHFGGCWERLVRSVNVALKATLKNPYPKDELLQTLIIEAEHVVNSHPLTHVSLDTEDDEAITPNHFLIGRSSNVQPFAMITEGEKNLREMWKRSEKLANQFWDRWVKEYLPNLLRRTKWHQPSKPLEVGDVVVLVNDNEARGSWPKGIVTKVFTGVDGKVRVAEVRTAKTKFTRPVSKIAVLDVRRESDLTDGHQTMAVITRAAAVKKRVVVPTSCQRGKRVVVPNSCQREKRVVVPVSSEMKKAVTQLPLTKAKRLGLMTIGQEVQELRISGLYRKIMKEYHESFRSKKKTLEKTHGHK